VAPDHDLAHLTDVELAPIVADDLHLHAVYRRADRTWLARALRMVERRDWRCLAESVALEDLAAERPLEAAHYLDGHRRSARDAQLQRREVEALALGMVEQGRVHGRYALEHGDPIPLDDLERRGWIEPRRERQASAGSQRCVEPAGLAERVEQRERAERDGVPARLE
jgi:hypothetical protein